MEEAERHKKEVRSAVPDCPVCCLMFTSLPGSASPGIPVSHAPADANRPCPRPCHSDLCPPPMSAGRGGEGQGGGAVQPGELPVQARLLLAAGGTCTCCFCRRRRCCCYCRRCPCLLPALSQPVLLCSSLLPAGVLPAQPRTCTHSAAERLAARTNRRSPIVPLAQREALPG